MLKPTAIRASRKEFTFEEKMYLARQMIKVDRELFKTPLVAAERAERKVGYRLFPSYIKWL